MNRKALIGTLIWIIILFLVISATVFFIFARDSIAPSSNTTNAESFPNASGEQNSTILITEVPSSGER